MIIKICRRAKNRESRRRLRQSAAAKNRAAGLTARRCDVGLTLRYDTRCYFNVRSKAGISQLNLPHGTDNQKSVKQKKTKK